VVGTEAIPKNPSWCPRCDQPPSPDAVGVVMVLVGVVVVVVIGVVIGVVVVVVDGGVSEGANVAMNLSPGARFAIVALVLPLTSNLVLEFVVIVAVDDIDI